MKKIVFLSACLLLVACANLIGKVSGGFYTSVNHQFKVKTPPIPKLSVQDGVLNERVFVDFYQSRGFWKKYGLYSIEWYKPALEIKSKKAFYSYAKNAAPSLAKSNFGSRGTFDVVDTRKLKVNTHHAYQFIANGLLDDDNAVWVGTIVKFNNTIALISIVIYSENPINTKLHGATVHTSIPWEKYNSFLNSFSKLKN